MSLPTFVAGYDGQVTYGGGGTALSISKWTMKASAGLLDRPNTTDGRRRIKGLPDLEGTISLTVDTAVPVETGLAPGTSVTLNLYTTSAKKITVAAIVDSFDQSNEAEGSYDAEIAWKWEVGKTLPSLLPA